MDGWDGMEAVTVPGKIDLTASPCSLTVELDNCVNCESVLAGTWIAGCSLLPATSTFRYLLLLVYIRAIQALELDAGRRDISDACFPCFIRRHVKHTIRVYAHTPVRS